MKPVDVKDTLKAFYNFKNKQKAFDLFIYLFPWYVKVYMYYANLFNTLYIEIKCKCYKNSIGQNKCTKISLFFMRAPTHDSFISNSQFLYKLKQKVHLSARRCGIFHFKSLSFILKFTFLFNKKHGLFDFKTSRFFPKLRY